MLKSVYIDWVTSSLQSTTEMSLITDSLTSGTTGRCVPVYFLAVTSTDIVEIDTASLWQVLRLDLHQHQRQLIWPRQPHTSNITGQDMTGLQNTGQYSTGRRETCSVVGTAMMSLSSSV